MEKWRNVQWSKTVPKSRDVGTIKRYDDAFYFKWNTQRWNKSQCGKNFLVVMIKWTFVARSVCYSRNFIFVFRVFYSVLSIYLFNSKKIIYISTWNSFVKYNDVDVLCIVCWRKIEFSSNYWAVCFRFKILLNIKSYHLNNNCTILFFKH